MMTKNSGTGGAPLPRSLTKPLVPALFSLLFPLLAQGQVIWVGPDCLISWSANPSEELVQGYKIYVNGDNPITRVEQNVGPATQITCGAIGLTQGVYETYVTAYNPAGESEPSNTVPFVLVTSAPNTPGGVTSPRNLSVESAGGNQN